MKNVACLILGGGKGTRLMPLTAYRSKPAVPLAGKYRLIDIPISNCINSGINRIYLLTQFNSVSLHRHIRQTFHFDPFSRGFVEILAAQQTNEGADWYQGTADAVRKHLRYIQQADIDYVLILSGDQLYRMNFEEMIKTHQEADADVTIAGLPIDNEQARAFGIMRLNDDGRVEGFLEKPQTPEELEIVRTDPAWLDARGIESKGRECLASMGIYLFNRETLVDLLEKTDYEDFGREVFPAAIRARHVQVHLFDGYWEDIGTIGAFFQANLDLASKNPPFPIDVADSPIYTRPRFLPPTRIDGATIISSLVADGCEIEQGAVIENSLVGLRCSIGPDATIRDSVLMGADYYQDDRRAQCAPEGVPPLGIGAGTVIERAIVDKDCRIGRNVTIRLPEGAAADSEHGPLLIRDGIVVVPKGTALPDGWSF
ncbi:Glucose-1-phosphate adenylyltransferase [Maioricimonas rarisocia]|uniref:Glucose-1-phosphate adenylyltransferase n=1 Tax=Maioricimonas rarisocia TaxID=2528026 RepID=A0A517Z8H1_9PLAN|nr:glucose-1-phosphate adenylyltransferase [Maioricimonas rarisocia]QDU38749.1 Glucose-1-phosphate adenylyltransferase [Maioricimonas rarisocia]